jgi:Tfp pilus assembly protein PilV
MKHSLHLRQRGIGLLDGMAALACLAFGMLAMTDFQTKLVAQATEAQQRQIASQLADELLNTALIDSTSNVSCYVLPVSGACPAGGATALAYTAAWQARVMAALPNATTPVVASQASGRLTVTLGWTWTSKNGITAAEPRTHTVTSDSR